MEQMFWILLSPFLDNIDNYEVFIVEPNEKEISKTLYFGKIKDIRKL